MDHVLQELIQAWRRGEVTGLATVVRTIGSAPLPVGSTMIVREQGTTVGSVSGGCVEGAVYEEAQHVVGGDAPHLARYGITEDAAYEVGLTCGGIIDVFVESISTATMPDLDRLVAQIDRGSPVALATIIDHVDSSAVGRHLVVGTETVHGSTGLSAHAERAIAAEARDLLSGGLSATVVLEESGSRHAQDLSVFVRSWVPRPAMLIFGAVDFAASLAQQGQLLGYRVTICDARPVFATAERFPAADEVVIAWPHSFLSALIAAKSVDRRTVICVLTHDIKFDVPVLELALRLAGASAPAFVGAMGSRRTHIDRLERLRERGLSGSQLDRLSSPVGLDLGGRTAQETALSIAAEIVASRYGGSGRRLAELVGPVHNGPAHGRVPANH